MVSNSQHGLLARKQSLRIIIFLLSVQNSALGTIISFKIMGISLCLHHQLRTFHSSFTPHPLRIRDFWIRLQKSQQNLDPSGRKGTDKKINSSTFIFKGHKQKFENSDSSYVYWWGREGGGGCRKITNTPFENKEGFKAAALLLNISEYRENGKSSSLFFPDNRIKVLITP